MSKWGGYEDQAFIADYYDFIPTYSARPDVDFYVDLARAVPGTILELGCGTGRILVPTAAAGSHIVGLDVSEHMLAKCREKLGAQSPAVRQRVRLTCGNMADFHLDETFALVTAPFRTFQHLISVDDQLSCLRCAYRHLAVGGRLVFDVFQVKPRAMMPDPALMKESQDFPEVELPDGRKLTRTHRIAAFHRAGQYNDIEFAYYVTHPNGETQRLGPAFPFRYFFPYEVEHLLARCGFEVVELLGDFGKSPLADDSPEMIFVAEKCESVPRARRAPIGRTRAPVQATPRQDVGGCRPDAKKSSTREGQRLSRLPSRSLNFWAMMSIVPCRALGKRSQQGTKPRDDRLAMSSGGAP